MYYSYSYIRLWSKGAVFERIFEEGLLNPTRISNFSQIFFKMLLCIEIFPRLSDHAYPPLMNGLSHYVFQSVAVWPSFRLRTALVLLTATAVTSNYDVTDPMTWIWIRNFFHLPFSN